MSYPRALTRAVLCMLLSLMLLACEEGGKGTPGSSGPREVVIIKLEPRREVYTTALAGRIASFQVAEVRPQVGGILQQRLFTEGADVKAGQALYQIDPATYEAALDSAQAALMKAEANVTPARLKAERFRELLAIKAVSKQEYDDAQAAFKQAEADVAVNRAAVKTARINLEYTKVRSPISGRIGKSAFTPGALVTANQAQALTSVRQLDPVYVDITQSSQDLLRLRAQFTNGELRSAAEEAPVRLKLENGAMYPHEGRLQFTDVTARPVPQSRTYFVARHVRARGHCRGRGRKRLAGPAAGAAARSEGAGFRAPCGRRRQGGRPACRRGPYRGRFVAGAFRLEARRPRHC